MFLAVPGVFSTPVVRATTVLGWRTATIAFTLWTIYSLVVLVACFARHRFADIVEHSCRMRPK